MRRLIATLAAVSSVRGKEQEVAVEPEPVTQGTTYMPVYFKQGSEEFTTTLDPYNLNMYLDYGPIKIYNDDRTLA